MEMVRLTRDVLETFYLLNYLVVVCSPLQSPENGIVILNGNIVGSTANYSCNENFTLVGPESRECIANAGWSGQDSLCSKFDLERYALSTADS